MAGFNLTALRSITQQTIFGIASNLFGTVTTSSVVTTQRSNSSDDVALDSPLESPSFPPGAFLPTPITSPSCVQTVENDPDFLDSWFTGLGEPPSCLSLINVTADELLAEAEPQPEPDTGSQSDEPQEQESSPQEQDALPSGPLSWDDAIETALTMSGLNKADTESIIQAVESATTYLRGTNTTSRPSADTPTLLSSSPLGPHVKVMATLLAVLADIEGRSFDAYQENAWSGIQAALEAIIAEGESTLFQARNPTQLKPMLTKLIDKRLLAQEFDLQQADFLPEASLPQSSAKARRAAKDFETLIDYIVVVSQVAYLANKAAREAEAAAKKGRSQYGALTNAHQSLWATSRYNALVTTLGKPKKGRRSAARCARC